PGPPPPPAPPPPPPPPRPARGLINDTATNEIFSRFYSSAASDVFNRQSLCATALRLIAFRCDHFKSNEQYQ
ncbi:hypothetical protein ACVGXE_21020, partial [Escherichia coli]